MSAPQLTDPPGRKTPRGSALIAGLAVAAAVELVGRIQGPDSLVIIPFTEMVRAAAGLLASPQFWQNAMLPTSVAGVAAGLLAVPLGAGIGLLIWWSYPARRIISPYLSVLPAVPFVALYPMLVAIVGTGTAPLIAVALLNAVVPVVTQTVAGMDSLPPTYPKIVRAMRMRSSTAVRIVYLPALARALAAAARLSLAYSFITVIASELILSTRGVGRAIRTAYDSFDLSTMYGCVIVVLALIGLLYLGLGSLQRRLLRWEADPT
jgi:NitT/TauT family transport system permease protein